jgi:NAD(P)-dependent dehydrogenase (short-subunit alcohol dehydrogenase family)
VTDLRERVAIVTGAGRGIGRAYATRLAAYGARVVVNDAGVATDGAATDEDPAADVVREIAAAGGDAIAHRGDIADSAVGDALVERCLETWGRLDIVINNAGFGRPRMVFNLSDEEWDDVVRVHLRGTFVVSRPACRHWRAEAKRDGATYGRLIDTATGLLLYGGAGQSNYVAAKAGVQAFTEAIATEMAPYGVTANTIMPGANTRLAQIGWRMARRTSPTRCRRRAVRSARSGARRRVRRIPRVTRRGLDLGSDVPGARRHRRARRNVVGTCGCAGARPRLHRRRLPRRDPAAVRRGPETCGPTSARVDARVRPGAELCDSVRQSVSRTWTSRISWTRRRRTRPLRDPS